MSNILKLYPHEGTQEAVNKIIVDANTPALDFDSTTTVPTFRHRAKRKNSRVNTRGNKPFHDKRPK